MNIRNLFNGTGLLIGITLLVSFIFLAMIFFNFFPEDEPSSLGRIPTSTPNNELTNREDTIPKATPQTFFNADTTTYTGSLVVTTSTPKVWVQLDPPDHTHAEVPVGQTENIVADTVPPQYPPFRFDNIPVGTHRLIAASEENYQADDISVEIKRGEVTQIHIELNPM